MKRSSLQIATSIGVLWMFALFSPTLRADTAPVTSKQIQSAIGKARDALLTQQASNGSWEPPGSERLFNGTPSHTWGGYTSLATYALLLSGSKLSDPPITKAETFLERTNISGIYCLGLRLRVWQVLYDQTGSAKFKTLAAKDVHTLLVGLNAAGPYAGMWGYNGNADRIDHSVSQFAVMGLSAGAQMGVEIPARVWTLIDRAWHSHQYDDGGWSYAGSPNMRQTGSGFGGERVSMSAAGVVTLLTTQDYINRTRAGSCLSAAEDSSIKKGLDYLTDRISDTYDLYTLCDIQRIAEITGQKYIGDTDWLATACSKIVFAQQPDGTLGTGMTKFLGSVPLAECAFELVILSSSRAPVIMDKLEYSFDATTKAKAHWENRPSDVYHLTRWASGRPGAGNFAWHLIKLSGDAQDLPDAPILYISGDQLLDLSPADMSKLRTFVQHNGLIAGNADCNSELFSKSFKSLGEKLFPRFEWRALDKDHPLFSYSHFRSLPHVWGLSDGKRELMVLFPTDLGRAWAQDAIEEHASDFELGYDLYQYAMEKTGWGKKK